MAKKPTARPAPRRHCTIRLPIGQDEYRKIIGDPKEFRQWLSSQFALNPELFPENFADGYELHSVVESKKLQVATRRIRLRDQTFCPVYPTFVMPYMTGLTAEGFEFVQAKR
jgi:hypothetical protein